jgi:predicted nucleic acid-binding protein
VIVCDTSGLLAFYDASSPHNDAARGVLEKDEGPYLVSPLVLAELDYFLLTRLGSVVELTVLRDITGGAYTIAGFDHAVATEATSLAERYSDMELGLTDASIAVIAARHRTVNILTLDERHFRVVRPLWGEAFKLLPTDAG